MFSAQMMQMKSFKEYVCKEMCGDCRVFPGHWIVLKGDLIQGARKLLKLRLELNSLEMIN